MLRATAKELGYEFNGIQVPEDESKDIYGISYSLMVVPLVKAIQEQQELIKKLRLKIVSQEQKNSDLEKRMERIEKYMKR